MGKQPLHFLVDIDFTEDNEPLLEVIRSKGHDFTILTRDEYFRQKPAPKVLSGTQTFAFTSLQYAKSIQNFRPDLACGVYCDLDALKCSNYYMFLPQDSLLNSNPMFVTWSGLEVLFTSLTFDIKKPIFIRPDRGDKGFPGTVLYDQPAIKGWVNTDYNFYSQFMNPLDLILVADARSIEVLENEYRLFIINRKVVCSSKYKTRGHLSVSSEVPNEVVEFAQDIANKIDFSLGLGYVLDICQAQAGFCYVIEINSLSCSGLYKCDLSKLVQAIIDEL